MRRSGLGRVWFVPLGLAAGVATIASAAGRLGVLGSALSATLGACAGALLLGGGDLRDDPGELATTTSARIRVWGAATLGLGLALAPPAIWAGGLAVELLQERKLTLAAVVALLTLVGLLAAAGALWLGAAAAIAPERLRPTATPTARRVARGAPDAPRPPTGDSGRPPTVVAHASPQAPPPATAAAGCACHRLPRDASRSPLEEPCLAQVPPEAARSLLRDGLVLYRCRETDLLWDITTWEERGFDHHSYVLSDQSVERARALAGGQVITLAPAFERELARRAAALAEGRR